MDTQSVIVITSENSKIYAPSLCTTSESFWIVFCALHMFPTVTVQWTPYSPRYLYYEFTLYLFRSESSAHWTILPSSGTMGQPLRKMCTTLSQVSARLDFKCHIQCQLSSYSYIFPHLTVMKSVHAKWFHSCCIPVRRDLVPHKAKQRRLLVECQGNPTVACSGQFIFIIIATSSSFPTQFQEPSTCIIIMTTVKSKKVCESHVSFNTQNKPCSNCKVSKCT